MEDDTETFRGCNCKNSKCIKLYCECFRNSVYCAASCNCHCCLNRSEHADVVQQTKQSIQARNPAAFEKKISQAGAQARHFKGCHCKKTGCLKKYCECYQAGVFCTEKCRCACCKNRPDNPERAAQVQPAHMGDEDEEGDEESMAAEAPAPAPAPTATATEPAPPAMITMTSATITSPGGYPAPPAPLALAGRPVVPAATVAMYPYYMAAMGGRYPGGYPPPYMYGYGMLPLAAPGQAASSPHGAAATATSGPAPVGPLPVSGPAPGQAPAPAQMPDMKSFLATPSPLPATSVPVPVPDLKGTVVPLVPGLPAFRSLPPLRAPAIPLAPAEVCHGPPAPVHLAIRCLDPPCTCSFGNPRGAGAAPATPSRTAHPHGAPAFVTSPASASTSGVLPGGRIRHPPPLPLSPHGTPAAAARAARLLHRTPSSATHSPRSPHPALPPLAAAGSPGGREAHSADSALPRSFGLPARPLPGTPSSARRSHHRRVGSPPASVFDLPPAVVEVAPAAPASPAAPKSPLRPGAAPTGLLAPYMVARTRKALGADGLHLAGARPALMAALASPSLLPVCPASPSSPPALPSASVSHPG
ncbi:putative transcription factor CPP [Paratrimastix pyriformis]|uniref:Transcription factor CPP n=1 Tax=Paratrimastix pyriformis TaxID=342808 RepID=A0ABQ8UT18_9EUKA|nr:putative transcription factor CPP [Paratrimastix pyriformis]